MFFENPDIKICAYECSLDLSLLTKWPVFVQNASGNPSSLSPFWKVRGQCHRSPASLLTAISSHCLAALPGTCPDVCVQQSHAAKRQYCNLQWTLEDLLPGYCYTLKTNSKTIHLQVLQPAPGLSDENFNKANSAKKRPAKSQTNWLKARKTAKFYLWYCSSFVTEKHTNYKK